MKQTSKFKRIFLRIFSLVLIQSFFCLNVSYVFSGENSLSKYINQANSAALSPQLCIGIESFQSQYANYPKFFQPHNHTQQLTAPETDEPISMIDISEQPKPEVKNRDNLDNTKMYHLSWSTIVLALVSAFISSVEFFSVLQVLGLTGSVTLLVLSAPYFCVLFMFSLISVMFLTGLRGIGHAIAAHRLKVKGRNLADGKGVFFKIDGEVLPEQRKQIIVQGKKIHKILIPTIMGIILSLGFIKWQVELAPFLIIPVISNIIFRFAKSVNTDLLYQEKTKFNKIYCTWKTLIQAFLIPFVYLRIGAILKVFAQSPSMTGLIKALTVPVSLAFIAWFALATFLVVMLSLILHEMGHNSAARYLQVERNFSIDKKGILMQLNQKLELEKIRDIVLKGITNNKSLSSTKMQLFWYLCFGIMACLPHSNLFAFVPLMIAKVNKVFSEAEEDKLFLVKTKGKNIFNFIKEFKDFISDVMKPWRKKGEPTIILLGGYFAVGKKVLYELLNEKLKGSAMHNRKIRIISIDRLLKTKSKREKNLAYPYNTYEYEKYIKMVEDFHDQKPIYLPFYLHIFSQRLIINKESMQLLLSQNNEAMLDLDGYKIIKLNNNIKSMPVENFAEKTRIQEIKAQIRSKRDDPEKYLQIFKELSEKPLIRFLVNPDNDIYVRINENGTGEILEQILPEEKAVHVFEFEQALTSERARSKAQKLLVVMASQKKRREYFIKRWREGLRYLHLSEEEISQKFDDFIQRENNDVKFKEALLKAQLILNTEVPIAEQLEKIKISQGQFEFKTDQKNKTGKIIKATAKMTREKVIVKISQALNPLRKLSPVTSNISPGMAAVNAVAIAI